MLRTSTWLTVESKMKYRTKHKFGSAKRSKRGRKVSKQQENVEPMVEDVAEPVAAPGMSASARKLAYFPSEDATPTNASGKNDNKMHIFYYIYHIFPYFTFIVLHPIIYRPICICNSFTKR